ncbi:venom toxin OcyC11 [Drosophila pseudoobscura]|uniref:Venom toxin OcyC11 n=1 Tax=Drosophila pseudoobscura pseudoobscura TaxID=46245 RepID=A0A6I8UZ76_DROPS|nr:venom toxin OcyC11 [Drosophila pseudoobscura]
MSLIDGRISSRRIMKWLDFVLCLVFLGTHSQLVQTVDLGCEFRGLKLLRGQSYQPADQCMQYTCQDAKLMVGKACPLVAGPKRCKLVSDATKPYPKCCPKLQC